MNKELIERLRNGQTFHCPECGVGFPVQDPTAADALEKMQAALDAANEQLNILTKDCRALDSQEQE